MEIEMDDEVEQDADLQDKHVARIKKHLATHQEQDDRVHKDRLKEKRLKVKKRLRKEAGLDDADRDD